MIIDINGIKIEAFTEFVIAVYKIKGNTFSILFVVNNWPVCLISRHTDYYLLSGSLLSIVLRTLAPIAVSSSDC